MASSEWLVVAMALCGPGVVGGGEGPEPPWNRVLLGLGMFCLGGSIGSFLNVVIYRLPRNESLIAPGSHCPRCGQAVRWHDNIPIVSWFVLRGRCRDCRGPISVRYPIMELLTAVMFVAVACSGPLAEAGPVRPAAWFARDVDNAYWPAVDAWLVCGYQLSLLSVLLVVATIAWDSAADALPELYPLKTVAAAIVAAVSAPSLWVLARTATGDGLDPVYGFPSVTAIVWFATRAASAVFFGWLVALPERFALTAGRFTRRDARRVAAVAGGPLVAGGMLGLLTSSILVAWLVFLIGRPLRGLWARLAGPGRDAGPAALWLVTVVLVIWDRQFRSALGAALQKVDLDHRLLLELACLAFYIVLVSASAWRRSGGTP